LHVYVSTANLVRRFICSQKISLGATGLRRLKDHEATTQVTCWRGRAHWTPQCVAIYRKPLLFGEV
jgi:hypothetical protein